MAIHKCGKINLMLRPPGVVRVETSKASLEGLERNG